MRITQSVTKVTLNELFHLNNLEVSTVSAGTQAPRNLTENPGPGLTLRLLRSVEKYKIPDSHILCTQILIVKVDSIETRLHHFATPTKDIHEYERRYHNGVWH